MQLPIALQADSRCTLRAQLAEQLRRFIEEGRLRPGAPVPTSRELGRQLGVSRNTITSAYETLVSEGYLRAEPAVGTFVAAALPKAAMLAQGGAGLEARSGSLYRALNLPLPYTGRGLPNLHRPAAADLTIDFVFGRTAARLFPERAWRKIVVDCLGGGAERMSEYNPPGGIAELRQLITNYLGPARGMVVAGFQQGIHLAAHLLVGTNTPVVMEAPTYRGAAFLFESYGGRILPVPVDAHGIDVGQLPAGRVKLVYVTPSHQFPTGVTMPLHRRLAPLEWAAHAGAYVLEVDYDADSRYEGSPLPSLQSLDRNGCVIYLNSFSRSIGPGLRIGYMVVPRDLIRPALTIKSLMDNGLPWLEQAALAQFMRDGSWELHLQRVRHAYELRRNVLLGALRTHVPGSEVSGTEGGTHLFVTLPPAAPPAATVQRACRALGVGIYPLDDSPAWLCEHMSGHERALLMGYTHLSEAQICRGIELIGIALAG